LFAFSIQCLKSHLPQIDVVVTIDFFVEVPRDLAREYWYGFEHFGVFVGRFVKIPLELTRAFPKFDVISLASGEEVTSH